MNEQQQQMISIPVKQYIDCIMAMQKLLDISLVVDQRTYGDENANFRLLCSIRAICSHGAEEGEKDGD